MAQLNPYLYFRGNCKDAMNFYHECLGGKLTLQTVGELPMAAQWPPETHNSVLHSSLETDGILLMASDGMGSDAQVSGNAVTLCLVCSTKEEINTIYAKLSAGGKIGHPLKEEFFGTIGDFQDKYGINWMVEFGMAPSA